MEELIQNEQKGICIVENDRKTVGTLWKEKPKGSEGPFPAFNGWKHMFKQHTRCTWTRLDNERFRLRAN